uniref:hypothetical protein n=1 Tax=Prevotella melaninogenica TaxID=28132 RepID=UPI00356B75D6
MGVAQTRSAIYNMYYFYSPELITIKPSVNKKFVELYLAHELSSKEFNRLYGEDMKRLGLKD